MESTDSDDEDDHHAAAADQANHGITVEVSTSVMESLVVGDVTKAENRTTSRGNVDGDGAPRDDESVTSNLSTGETIQIRVYSRELATAIKEAEGILLDTRLVKKVTSELRNALRDGRRDVVNLALKHAKRMEEINQQQQERQMRGQDAQGAWSCVRSVSTISETPATIASRMFHVPMRGYIADVLWSHTLYQTTKHPLARLHWPSPPSMTSLSPNLPPHKPLATSTDV